MPSAVAIQPVRLPQTLQAKFLRSLGTSSDAETGRLDFAIEEHYRRFGKKVDRAEMRGLLAEANGEDVAMCEESPRKEKPPFRRPVFWPMSA